MPNPSLADLQRELTAPFFHEDLGTSDAPLVVADLGDLSPDLRREGADEALVARLHELPAITVGVLPEPLDPKITHVAEAFDVLFAPPSAGFTELVIETDDPGGAVAELRSAIEDSPLAAVTLVQLLRMQRTQTVRDALMAESLAYATLQTSDKFQDWLATSPEAAAPTSEPTVIVDRTASTLHLTLNQPDRHNAFSATMRDELVTALRAAAADPSLDGVTLRGAGESFCSGGDLGEFGTVPSAAAGHHVRSVRSPAWWLHTLRAKVRVHVHGVAIGAGIELPAFCSAVIADRGCEFALPEVGFGLVPGAGGTVSVARRIGRHRTAWMALTGARIDAPNALRWGLVDRLEG